MIPREIFSSLEAHLSQKQITVITGMRRVGKSTALRYLLNKVEHTNKRYLDCERIEVRVLLNRPDYESIADELQLSGLDFSSPCVIALDEIQLVVKCCQAWSSIYMTRMPSNLLLLAQVRII
ncbi:MAG: AAA family ATPase [Cytophagales bacterium]|nr:AAA family ATPase [Cytophagales bacterium]